MKSFLVSDKHRMDAARLSYLAGNELPDPAHVKMLQVEYYGNITLKSNHQSTTIPQLRLSTDGNFPKKVIYIVQQNHHNTHLAVQSAIWGQRTTVLLQLLAALKRNYNYSPQYSG